MGIWFPRNGSIRTCGHWFEGFNLDRVRVSTSGAPIRIARAETHCYAKLFSLGSCAVEAPLGTQDSHSAAGSPHDYASQHCPRRPRCNPCKNGKCCTPPTNNHAKRGNQMFKSAKLFLPCACAALCATLCNSDQPSLTAASNAEARRRAILVRPTLTRHSMPATST
jgi:hypothetical protein